MKIINLSAIFFMILALSRSPCAINLKFTPEIFSPQKKSCGCQWTYKLSYISFRQMGEWQRTCLQIVTLKVLLTVCYVADCYMIRHLPGIFFDFIVKNIRFRRSQNVPFLA